MSREVEAAARAASLGESARIVSTLVRVTGDWDLAEDCMQDAFARALEVWERDGIPSNPGAWLTTVARNRAIDLLRRAAVERRAVVSLGVQQELEQTGDTGMTHASDDDRLSLIFTCCHPALPMDARVALTLRTVAGLSVPEIARAFLVSESTMDKRLVRARAKIRNAGIPYRVPPLESRAERVSGVLAVLYLLFSEGYSATESTQLIREPLAVEAIRLDRILIDSLGTAPFAGSPLSTEATGLLALMLLQHARGRSRVGADGELVTLEQQDRSLWDREAVREGVELLDGVARELVERGVRPGPYVLQASIAACHALAPDFASTDFRRIVTLYEQLARSFPSPIVDLNHAVAVAMAEGPAAGLLLVEELDDRGALADYYLLPATRADLLRRLDRGAEASEAYRRALELAPSPAERRYLRGRIAELEA